MKGIIFASGLFLVALNLFIVIVWYSDFEHSRSLTSSALKRSMLYTAETSNFDDKLNETTLFEALKINLRPLLKNDLNYTLSLLGFQSDPFYFKVKLSVKKEKGLFYHFDLKETLIEQLKQVELIND